MLGIPAYAIIVVGTLLVTLASLERILGRPIPLLRHSKPVPKQAGYIIVPAVMTVIFGVWVIDLPRGVYGQSLNGWQRFLEAAHTVLIGAALAASVGLVLYLACWFVYLAARLVAGIARLFVKWQKQ